MEFKIEKGLDMPKNYHNKPAFFAEFPFDAMEIGDAVKISETVTQRDFINKKQSLKNWLTRKGKDYKSFSIKRLGDKLYIFKVQ